MINLRTIAFIGARGYGGYGGFETFVKNVSDGLANDGSTVFIGAEGETNLNEEKPSSDRIHIVRFPLRMPKIYVLRHLMELFYDLYFLFFFSLKKEVGTLYFMGPTLGLAYLFPRLWGKKVLVNMAGMEWKRSKFSSFQRLIIKIQFLLSTIGSQVFVIDNPGLKEHVPKSQWNKVQCIPYGVDKVEKTHPGWDGCASLEKYGYILAIVRLQPDNNIEEMIKGYYGSKSTLPLVLIGGYSSSKQFENEIRKLIDQCNIPKQIISPGPIYDKESLDWLRINCKLYIHPHSIGGTNPSLLEAMICGLAILARDNVFNRFVTGDSASYYFDSDSLSKSIDQLVGDCPTLIKMRESSYAISVETFSIENMIDKVREII